MNYALIKAEELEKLCREKGPVPEKRRRQIVDHIRDASKGAPEGDASVQAIHSALLGGLEKDELVFLKRALGLDPASLPLVPASAVTLPPAA